MNPNYIGGAGLLLPALPLLLLNLAAAAGCLRTIVPMTAAFYHPRDYRQTETTNYYKKCTVNHDTLLFFKSREEQIQLKVQKSEKLLIFNFIGLSYI